MRAVLEEERTHNQASFSRLFCFKLTVATMWSSKQKAYAATGTVIIISAHFAEQSQRKVFQVWPAAVSYSNMLAAILYSHVCERIKRSLRR